MLNAPRSHANRATITRRSWFFVRRDPPSDGDRISWAVAIAKSAVPSSSVRWRSDRPDESRCHPLDEDHDRPDDRDTVRLMKIVMKIVMPSV